MDKIRMGLKKVEVVYTDVDGTLITNGSLFRNKEGYTLKNVAAIYELLNAGVDIVMTTSRTKEQLKEIARLLGFKNYICDLGCEIVYNRGEKVLKNYDAESRKELKERILGTGVVESLFERYRDKIRYYAPWAGDVKTHPLLIGELDFEEVQIWFSEEYPELRIIDNGPVPPEKGFRSPHAYHILPKNVGKRIAVVADKKERGLRKENLIAIGDSVEDISMAPEVGVYFSLNDSIKTQDKNVIYVDNRDGEGFYRVVKSLKDAEMNPLQ